MEFSGSTETIKKGEYYEIHSKTSLIQLEQKLFEKVWYIRHQVLKEEIKNGVKTCSPDIWKGARKGAKRIEKEHGIKNLYYENDFEWGKINGMFSAVRWILGDEWDFLDT